jgi:hypothetical protein
LNIQPNKESNMTTDTSPAALTIDKIGTVSPALARFTTETIVGNLWKRDVISLRDRSLVTVAALIQRSQPIELGYHMGLAPLAEQIRSDMNFISAAMLAIWRDRLQFDREHRCYTSAVAASDPCLGQGARSVNRADRAR